MFTNINKSIVLAVAATVACTAIAHAKNGNGGNNYKLSGGSSKSMGSSFKQFSYKKSSGFAKGEGDLMKKYGNKNQKYTQSKYNKISKYSSTNCYPKSKSCYDKYSCSKYTKNCYPKLNCYSKYDYCCHKPSYDYCCSYPCRNNCWFPNYVVNYCEPSYQYCEPSYCEETYYEPSYCEPSYDYCEPQYDSCDEYSYNN